MTPAPARPRLPALALAILVALAPAGCGAMGTSDAASRELSTAQFDDVPVPGEFNLETAGSRSFSYAEGGNGPAAVRVGRMEYTGRAEPAEVLAFYLREMPRPIHGWDAGARLDDERILFTRGDDRCLVRVEKVGGVTRVVIDRNTRAAREAG